MKVTRLILKEDDVLVVKLPQQYIVNTKAIKSIYTQIKKQLLPRKNKILVLPYDMEIAVIGNKEVKEYITEIDIWQLWDEEGDEIKNL